MAVIDVEIITTPSNNIVVTNTGIPVVQIVGPPVIANVVVSPTAPPNPFEGQIWIDIS